MMDVIHPAARLGGSKVPTCRSWETHRRWTCGRKRHRALDLIPRRLSAFPTACRPAQGPCIAIRSPHTVQRVITTLDAHGNPMTGDSTTIEMYDSAIDRFLRFHPDVVEIAGALTADATHRQWRWRSSPISI